MSKTELKGLLQSSGVSGVVVGWPGPCGYKNPEIVSWNPGVVEVDWD